MVTNVTYLSTTKIRYKKGGLIASPFRTLSRREQLRRASYVAICSGTKSLVSVIYPKKMLGKSARVIILANNGSTHEVLRDCILLREISRAEQRGQHRSSFSGASLSPYRVTP